MALFKKKHSQAPLFKGKRAPEHMEHPVNKKSGSKKTIIGAAVVLIILIAAFYFYFLNGNEQGIATPAVVNLTEQGSIFNVNSQQYLISLSTISLSTGKAYIHISKLPIFLNPLINVTLTLNNITKVNAGSAYANIGVQMQSVSANSITVQVSPLLTSLQIVPDSQNIQVIQGTLYNSGWDCHQQPQQYREIQ